MAEPFIPASVTVEPEPEPKKSPSQVGEEIGGLLDGAADLFRRGGRVVEKLGKLIDSAEKIVGPLNRPLDAGPDRKA
jgi:hypothetical protein